jgi:DNA-binding response OmpR family regulator
MPKVLVVEDDRGLGDLLYAILTDEGYEIAVLSKVTADAVRVAVGQLEPDCILLDGEGAEGYGTSWEDAAWVRARARPIPTIMFTAHEKAVKEAREGISDRAQQAGFAGILPKPFNVDELVEMVARVIGPRTSFDSSPEAEAERTRILVEKLRESGASDIQPSSRREWATFRNPHGALVQVYWWQRDSVYNVLCYEAAGDVTHPIGRFYDLDAALAVSMLVGRQEP